MRYEHDLSLSSRLTSTHSRLWNLVPFFELPWVIFIGLLTTLIKLIQPTAPSELLLVALFLFWPLTRQSQKYLGFTHAVATGSLTAFLWWVPISFVAGIQSTQAWTTMGYLLLGIGMYHACINFPWFQYSPLRLAVILLTFGGILSVLTPPFIRWKGSFRLFYVPLYDWFQMIDLDIGDTIHANVLAGALILLLPISLGLLMCARHSDCKVRLYDAQGDAKTVISHSKRHRQSKLWQMGYLALSLLLISLTLLTQSRGSYLSLVILLLLIALLRWQRLIYLVPILVVGLLFLIYRLGFGQIFELLGADNTFGGAEWRTPVWQASWQAFQDFAWTGIGVGNFQRVMPLLYPNPAINSEAATHAHNLLLQIGLDLGIPGLAAYLLFYGTMVGMAIAVLRRTRSPQTTATALGATWDGNALIAPPTVGVTISTGRFMRQLTHLERTRQQHWALAAGCLAALVGMQVHGLLDAVTWGNKLAFLPWLIFAQITLLYRYHTAPPDRPRQEEHEL